MIGIPAITMNNSINNSNVNEMSALDSIKIENISETESSYPKSKYYTYLKSLKAKEGRFGYSSSSKNFKLNWSKCYKNRAMKFCLFCPLSRLIKVQGVREVFSLAFVLLP